MQAGEWFHISDFPAATVTLSNFTATDNNGYTSDALITIKDTSLTVPFAFTLTYEGETALMNGSAKLSREAFNLGQESDANGDWVSPEIDVSVTVKASPISR